MKRIIFGGTFDPIHKGHESILKSAMQHTGATSCILVPNLKTTYKQTTTNPIDRLNMVKIVAQKNHWDVSEYEISQTNQVSYTINTVKHFKALYPMDELYLLIGSDQLNVFDTWYQYQDILNYVTLLIYPRSNYDKSLLNKYHAFAINDNQIFTNSSDIRKYFLVDDLDADVLKYIMTNGLYAQNLLKTYMDEERYLHSMRVAQTAKMITALQKPELQHKAWLAGLYHDLAKCFSQSQQEMIAYDYLGLAHDSWKVLHGPVGAYYLHTIYHFDDKLILDAIMRHTKPYNYGSPITFLDKVLYCADKLEPNRTDTDINNIEYFRILFKQDVDKCFDELYAATQKQYNE